MTSVDVVVPCFQHAAFLRDCVESALAQDVDDLRVLIIDNASTDGSAEVARRLAAEDARVEVVVRAENLGPHASFNEGVDRARRRYLLILCSDDLLAEGALAAMVAAMERRPEVSFAYGADVHWPSDAPRPRPITPAATEWRIESGASFIEARCGRPEAYIAAGMVLVRTEAHRAAGHYRPSLPHTDDFEMLLRLALLGPVARTDAVVGVKRIHAANRTHAFHEARTTDLIERMAALESFFAREGRQLPEADGLLRLGRRRIAERAYWCGMKDLARGRRSSAGLLRLALRHSPRMALLPPLGYVLRNGASFRGASS